MGRGSSMTYVTQAEVLMRAKKREEEKSGGKGEGYLTRAEALLSAMGEEETTLEAKKPRKTYWSQIFMACFCVLAIAAAAKGFLYLDTEVSAIQSAVGPAIKELNTVKAQMIAADTREQLAAVTAQLEDLKRNNAQLRAEMREIKEAFETVKARKSNVAAVQRKHRSPPLSER